MKAKAIQTPLTIPVSEKLLIRLYQDTKPHQQLTTTLQKGLILIFNGTEQTGEGIGLGAPAIRYKGRTYFSGSSTLEFEQTRHRATAVKKFNLDLTTRRTLGNISLETSAVRKIWRRLDKLYMAHRHMRLMAGENMLKKAGIKRAFVQTKPVGTVNVTYSIDPPNIGIETEFNVTQKTDLQEIYLLNEQGSTHFRKYYDAKGTVLFDTEIGAWETVNAHWACIYNVKDRFGFRLWRHKHAVLHRGREFLNGTLDWIGLDYEANPENMHFNYNIELVRS